MSNSLSYRRLGDFIERCEGRNSKGNFSFSDMRGVNNEGKICNSIAKTDGLDLSAYKIAHTGDFIYNPARLDLGSISRLKEKECIVSTLYVVFRVRQEMEGQLLPEYLEMWVHRSEFHRYVSYVNWGSAREYFWFDDMCEVYLPIPDINTQRRVVAEYQTVESRIEINNNLITKLEETACAIFKKMFVDDINTESLPEGWHIGTFGEVAKVSSGKSLSDKQDTMDESFRYPVAGASGIIGYSNDYNQEPPFITTGRVGTIGVVKKYKCKSWTADNVLVVNSDFYEFSYQILKSIRYEDIMKGGVQSLITQTDLKNAPIIVPSADALKEFEHRASKIDAAIDAAQKENNLLSTLSSLLLEKMSKE